MVGDRSRLRLDSGKRLPDQQKDGKARPAEAGRFSLEEETGT